MSTQPTAPAGTGIPPPEPNRLWGWLDTKISLWAVCGAVLTLFLWALQVDARSKDAERVNAVQERRLEAVEAAIKTLALQGYQQEQMGRQLTEMSAALKEMQRVPAAIEVLSFRMGNVETAVGASPPPARRGQR